MENLAESIPVEPSSVPPELTLVEGRKGAPVTASLLRLCQLSGGVDDVYLMPYGGKTVGAVCSDFYRTYILIEGELERAHRIPAAEVKKRGKELRAVGVAQFKRRELNNGFSLQGKVNSMYWETKPYKPRTGFKLSSPEGATPIDLHLLALMSADGDKLRKSFPIVSTETSLLGCQEGADISVAHGGAIPTGMLIPPEALTRLAKGVTKVRVEYDLDEDLLVVHGAKCEIRVITLVGGNFPVYATPNTTIGRAVSEALTLKEIKAWARRTTKAKGYQPAKVYTVGEDFHILFPGAGPLRLGGRGGWLIPTTYYDVRAVMRVLKAWTHPTVTFEALAGGLGLNLCYREDGIETIVGIDPLGEY
jgi:hypothetical protein